ncbi:Tricyclene synthase [Abeliophyllum distichum]|uniref:Tricyclene synthase n=1 Tax=Abeliophyllum distichum TaxID=126358 RepID=A0ABD1P932_9LAMI
MSGRGRGRGLNRTTIKRFKCHQLGHFQYECLKWEKAANYAEIDEDEELLLMAFVEENKSSREGVWFLDSGCSNHMTWNIKWFTEFDKDYRHSVKLGNNMRMGEVGDVKQVVSDVYYIPELKNNLLWLVEKLPFARDRLVECFFCTIGGLFEPQYGFCRTILTKVMSLLTVIDDIYGVYGTLEELELFTCAIERWDVNTIEQLPDYMQICYLAVVNFVNEMAYDILKDRGLVIIPYLRTTWTDICKAYLQEAKWYFNGYTPTLEEYMKNACITISAHVIMSHAFFSVTNPIEKEAVEYLQKYPVVIHWLATILRLADDLATSSDELKRGDVATSIQCYMKDTGASEDEARKHIKFLIRETWKKLNKDQHVDSPFSQTFIGIAVNFARMAKYLYQHGDGLGIQNLEVKHRIIAYSSLAENLNSMAIININILKPISVCTFKNELPKMAFSLGANTNVLPSSVISTKPCNQTVIRRSGNYRPPIWEFDYIQSLNSEYMGGRSVARASELKMQVKMMLDEAKEPIDQLELIDDLQRLGISYHFEDDIKHILTIINRKYSKNREPGIKDLYATAL